MADEPSPLDQLRAREQAAPATAPAPAASEPAPGGQAAGDDAAPARPAKPTDVPLEKYLELGAARKRDEDRYERQLAELRAELAGLKQGQPAAAKPAAETNPYNPDEQPLEHNRWETQQLRRQIEQQQAKIQDDAAQLEQANGHQQVLAYVDGDLAAAQAENAAFRDAHGRFVQNLIQVGLRQGMNIAAARQNAINLQLQIAAQGAQMGLTPRQSIGQYLMAFAAQPAPQAEPAGDVETSVSPAAAMRDAGQAQAGAGLGAVPGGQGKAHATLRSLAAQPEGAFVGNAPLLAQAYKRLRGV